jgi:hypothetical protein
VAETAGMVEDVSSFNRAKEGSVGSCLSLTGKALDRVPSLSYFGLVFNVKGYKYSEFGIPIYDTLKRFSRYGEQ